MSRAKKIAIRYTLLIVKPFHLAFHHATVHGIVAAVYIPDAPDPVPEEILLTLPTEESDFARTLKGYRQVQFVGGRIAVRHAASQLRVDVPPLLPDARGAPCAPPELSISISHKSELALAMVSLTGPFKLGVDLETYGPARMNIAPKVLTKKELDDNQAIENLDARWIDILLRFSIKESIYKAIDPFVHRYVGFEEAIVSPSLEGTASVELCLKNGEGPFWVDARYEWLHGHLLTSVRLGKPLETGRVIE